MAGTKYPGVNVTGIFNVINSSNTACTVFLGFSLIAPGNVEVPIEGVSKTVPAGQTVQQVWDCGPITGVVATYLGLWKYRMCVWTEDPNFGQNPNAKIIVCTPYNDAFTLAQSPVQPCTFSVVSSSIT